MESILILLEILLSIFSDILDYNTYHFLTTNLTERKVYKYVFQYSLTIREKT
jgi:hypothetical protein